MALVGVSMGDTEEYVSDHDPCKRKVKVPIDPKDASKGTKTITEIDPGATKFMVGPLDVQLSAAIYDNQTSISQRADGTVGTDIKVNQSHYEAVRFGLQGWENFLDKDGKQIPFKREKTYFAGRERLAVTEACMSALGLNHVRELGGRVKALSAVVRSEEKNSDTA